MDGRDGIEHHSDDRGGGQRREQAEREKDAAEELAQSRDGRERLARSIAEAVEEAAGAFDPVATEPAEELLRAVTGEEEPDDDTKQEDTGIHEEPPDASGRNRSARCYPFTSA